MYGNKKKKDPRVFQNTAVIFKKIKKNAMIYYFKMSLSANQPFEPVAGCFARTPALVSGGHGTKHKGLV